MRCWASSRTSASCDAVVDAERERRVGDQVRRRSSRRCGSTGSTSGRYSSPWALSGVSCSSASSSACAVERVDPGVDLADLELLGRRVALAALRLDDLLDVAGRRRGPRGRTARDRRAPSWPSCAAAPLTSCALTSASIASARDQRHVAREDHDGRVGVDVGRRRPAPRRPSRWAPAGSRPRRPRAADPRAGASGCRPRRPSRRRPPRRGRTGHRISGRPQSGCRTLGSAERMRVPSPAAMITTVGADTVRIVVSRLRRPPVVARDLLGSGVKAAQRTLTAASSGSNPGSPVRFRPSPGANICSCRGTRKTKFASSRRGCEHARARCCAISVCGPAGGNYRLLRRWLDEWDISTEHFTAHRTPHVRAETDPAAARGLLSRIHVRPAAISSERLYDEGPQAARVRAVRPGRGVARASHGADPRPHQRRRRRQPAREPADRVSELRRDAGHALRTRIAELEPGVRGCGADVPQLQQRSQRHCSQACGSARRRAAAAQRTRRRVERPPYERWWPRWRRTGGARSGGEYGVSDNAVRKWVRAYERERAANGGGGLPGRKRFVRRAAFASPNPYAGGFMRLLPLAAAVAALLVPAAPAFAGDPTMPLWQVRPGCAAPDTQWFRARRSARSMSTCST